MSALCIMGADPGLSGAVAYRVIAEDMPVASGMVDCATLAARIRTIVRDDRPNGIGEGAI
jgi:hypothetical protein